MTSTLVNTYPIDFEDHLFNSWLAEQADKLNCKAIRCVSDVWTAQGASRVSVRYETDDTQDYLQLLIILYSGLQKRSDPHFWPYITSYCYMAHEKRVSTFNSLSDILVDIRALEEEISSFRSAAE
ncbi:hypothetical protein [Curvivirga aplysinae]|uniref:hypothetical protein n=1 Tax=Curvivirga aplysinae TaxID=2529852 RepID=UPI0012BD45EE|nr:hypothetical protein [Curvivirga aplysinae]MTI10173.1 hypothetical protein [Curvivirga aplysinae]